jgi:hypothetical protein
VRFKADVGDVERQRQGAPLMHPEAAGGCEARGAREGAGWVDQGGGGAGARSSEVMRSAGSRPKSAFVFDFLFAFGVWWVTPDTGWFSA